MRQKSKFAGQGYLPKRKDKSPLEENFLLHSFSFRGTKTYCLEMEWSCWDHGNTSMRVWDPQQPIKAGGAQRARDPDGVVRQLSQLQQLPTSRILVTWKESTPICSRHYKWGFLLLIAEAFHLFLQNQVHHTYLAPETSGPASTCPNPPRPSSRS